MTIKNIPQSLLDAVNKVLMNEAQEEHPMIEVDGAMKHRLNSLGQPIHHTEEGIKNFHRWFGDSKAVDEHGRPLVVYHGTASDVEHFDPIKAQSEGSAFFFSHSSLMKNKADNANMYAKSRGPKSDANVVPVYLKISNLHKSGFAEDIPSDEAKISHWLDRMDKFNRKHADDKVSYYRQEIKSAIRDNKDGVVFKNIQDVPDNVAGRFVNESDVYAVFHPHQIKSAIGNSGAFSHSTKITESTKVYYRGTNNKNEPDLITSGKLRPSIDHLTGKSESGVSVSDVPDVGKYFQYLYKVTGTELSSVGSDGEPLLDPETMKFVKWVKAPTLAESEEYRGSHTAPGPDYGAPAHDLTRDIYPSDFYSSRGARLYGDGRDDDYKVHSQLRTLHNRPEAEVNIYRAVPNDSTIKEINPGDWVTTNLQYAHDHGERFDGHKILSKRVKAKELFTDGNSFHEFGYHPQD